VQQVVDSRYPVVGMSSQALLVMSMVMWTVVVGVNTVIAAPSSSASEVLITFVQLALVLAGTATAIVGWQLARRRDEFVPLGRYTPSRTLTRRQRRVVRRQIRGREPLTAASAPIVSTVLRERVVSARANRMTNAGCAIGLVGLGLLPPWIAVPAVAIILAVGATAVVSYRTDTRRLAAVERAFPAA
jgi:cytochrome c biogenesis protein CcdA